MSRIVYFGTPWVAVAPLRALVEAGHQVVIVVTKSDKKRGRSNTTSASDVKQAALDLGIVVTHSLDDIREANADLGVVVAYGKLMPKWLLEKFVIVNLHFSILPRWRGAAPVERAILAGDTITGVSLMLLEESLDTGPVYGVETVKIKEDETAAELKERLVQLGCKLLVEKLKDGVVSLGEPVPQIGDFTYAAPIQTSELKIDWNQSACQIQRLVRIGNAWTPFGQKRLKIHKVRKVDVSNNMGTTAISIAGEEVSWSEREAGAMVYSSKRVFTYTGEGWLELLEVQMEGGRRMPASVWAQGARLT
ncbi:MAG: methionyl-tRNA formyltransferase [Actinobacteria bacterium]|nr:methionyl-tRNA formyltransferase [Actinomycetota bacterium]MCL6105150.1 methionyl-tRNA formyltransferase [Actinomycetota bacterium]